LNINPRDSLINWIFVAAFIVNAHDNCSLASYMTERRHTPASQVGTFNEIRPENWEIRVKSVDTTLLISLVSRNGMDVRDCQPLDMDECSKYQ